MAEVTYSDSFIQQAQERLKEMVEKNLVKLPYGKPFSNFTVVIGDTDKRKIAIIDIPTDLKEKIGNRKAYVVID